MAAVDVIASEGLWTHMTFACSSRVVWHAWQVAHPTVVHGNGCGSVWQEACHAINETRACQWHAHWICATGPRRELSWSVHQVG